MNKENIEQLESDDFENYENRNCYYCNKGISDIEYYNWGGCCVKCAIAEDTRF